jgi:hypothetical protein
MESPLVVSQGLTFFTRQCAGKLNIFHRYGLARKCKIFDRFGDGQKNLVFSTSIYFSDIIICSPVFQNIEFRSTTVIFIFQWHFDFRQVEPRFWTILNNVKTQKHTAKQKFKNWLSTYVIFNFNCTYDLENTGVVFFNIISPACVKRLWIFHVRTRRENDVRQNQLQILLRDCSLFIVQGETEEKLYSYNIFSLPPS